MAVSFAPLVPMSASAGELEQADGEIEELLAQGDYAEGEAIVIIDQSVSSPSSLLRLFSIDLLSSAETLMEVPTQTYAETTGEEIANTDAASDDANVLRSQSASSSDVSIVLVRSDTMSTAELLYALRDDPRLLSVEPNRIYSVSDPTETEEDQSIAVLTETLGEETTFGRVDQEATEENSAFELATEIEDLSLYQWSCDNTAETLQTGSAVAGFDINPPLWNEENETNAVGTVAVIDTGIDYNHPDLSDVMYDASSFAARTGVGGKYGFNAVDETKQDDPMDSAGHGTHCAGITLLRGTDPVRAVLLRVPGYWR